ncbi:MAG TPA: LamG domain-containing protein [Capillimicrobium sp.]|nr:LamG domain-containing protein [Capillimicrobium sp.]
MSVARYTALEVPTWGWAQTAGPLGVPLDGSVPFSVDAWIKLDGLSTFAGALDQEGGFAFGASGTQVLLQVPGWAPVTSTPAHPLGERDWHHICATYDGGQVRLYVDGEFDSAVGAGGATAPVGGPWRMGSGLQGLVRTVRVFDAALDAQQVRANLFGAPPVGTVANAFDFTQSPPVDTGPAPLPVSLQGGARIVTRTPGVHLRDTAYVHPMVEQGVNPGGARTDPYTVQAWVHLDPQDAPVQVIFTNSDLLTGTGMALIAVADDDVPGTMRLWSTRGSATDDEALVSTTMIPARRWTNVATTFDGTTLSLFIDGRPAGTMAAAPIPLVQLDGDPMIGGSHTPDEPLADWTAQGWIARLDVWSRALTTEEIGSAAGAPPDPTSDHLEASYDFSRGPVRDAVDSHPVGLVDGAVLMPQVMAGAVREAVVDHGFAGYAPLEDHVLERLLAEVDRGDEPFMVTHHVVGDERILLLHDVDGVHLAYRGAVADIDDCTMWRIELLFTIVAGLLSVVFAIRATLSPRAIGVARQMLRNPRVAAALSTAGKLTAASLMAMLGTLYAAGGLGDLLWALLVGVGVWAVLRIVARVLGWATGFGVAEVIAVAALAVYAVIEVWLRRPSSCNPPAAVQLAAIKFNWDPTSSSVDALSIRRDYLVALSAPEWVRTNPAGSAAAYAISSVAGKTPQIQAKFVIADTTAQQATIQATGGGPLGAIDPIVVNFANGVSVPEYVTIPLNHHTIPAGGVRAADATWTWTVQQAGGPAQPLATTQHRIYVTLSAPNAPWGQPPYVDQTQVPWTEALELACRWAQGQTTADGVQRAITAAVNGSLGLKYDTSGGASFYTYTDPLGTSYFHCGAFIAQVNGTGGLGVQVNCTDCATIVTTFANILGGDLFGATMTDGPAFGGFLCNQIQPIGWPTWQYPFGSGRFRYHEVAWTGAGGLLDPLYDACLQYDTSTNPWDWSPGTSHTPGLPTKVPFTNYPLPKSPPLPVPLTANVYRERLAQNSNAGIGSCTPTGAFSGTNGGRRKVL